MNQNSAQKGCDFQVDLPDANPPENHPPLKKKKKEEEEEEEEKEEEPAVNPPQGCMISNGVSQSRKFKERIGIVLTPV